MKTRAGKQQGAGLRKKPITTSMRSYCVRTSIDSIVGIKAGFDSSCHHESEGVDKRQLETEAELESDQSLNAQSSVYFQVEDHPASNPEESITLFLEECSNENVL